MSALDRSRPARMAVAFLGLVVASTLGVILGVVRQAGWISLICHWHSLWRCCLRLLAGGRRRLAHFGEDCCRRLCLSWE